MGRTVQYQYDGSNRLSQVADPAGGTWQYTYDANGDLQTATSGGQTTMYNYDVIGNLTAVTPCQAI